MSSSQVINIFQMRNSVLFCYKTCACNKSWAGSQRSGLPAFRDGVPFIALRCHMILYDALWSHIFGASWRSIALCMMFWYVPQRKHEGGKVKIWQNGAAFYCPPDDTCQIIFEAKMVKRGCQLFWVLLPTQDNTLNRVAFYCHRCQLSALPYAVSTVALSSLDQLV